MAEAIAETSKKEDLGISAKMAESKADRPSNLCCYSQKICNLEKLKGFDFCHKHILEDKASPFKPCDFVAKSNERRCPNPAPKLPNRGKSFCIIHTRKAELRRAVEERRKRRRCDSVEGNYHESDKGKRRRTSSVNSQRSDKVDGHSSEDDAGGSGEEYLKVDSAWHGGIDSDADSVDSEEEDPLKHAGVWTTEEATRMCRDKMIRLRSLYIAQFKRLQHVLKERQRKYCQAIQAEEEEETGECHLTPAQLLGPKLQHKRPGTEALLHRQAKEKRVGTTARQQNMPHLRCTFAAGGNRCNEKVLPLTKHCIKHITHDPHQLLYQRCSFPSRGDSQCEMNAPKIFNHSTCRLHMELPGSMKRPHIKNDLLEAKERAKARLATLVETTEGGKEAVLPEALHQKSSALIPPAMSGQSDDTLPVSCQSPSSTPIPSSIETKMESASSEIMNLDSDVSQKESSAEIATSTKTKESSSTTLKSDESSVLASENISPGLAAASLIVVCSSPQAPLKGAPLASTSGVQQPSNTAFREEASKLLSSEVSKSDGKENDSQVVAVSEGVSTPSKAQETESEKTSSGSNTAVAKSSSDTSEISEASVKAAVTSEIKRSVASSTNPLSAKREVSHGAALGAAPNFPDASQRALPSVPQGVKQGAPHDGPQGVPQSAPPSARPGVNQGVKQGASHDVLQGASPIAPQSAPPIAPPGVKQGVPQNVSQGAPQGAKRAAPLDAPQSAPPGVKQGVPQIVSQGAPQGVKRGAPHDVPQSVQPSAPPGVKQGVPRIVSQGAPQGVKQGAPQGAREDTLLVSSKESLQTSSQTGDRGASACKPLLKGTQQGESTVDASIKKASARSGDPPKSSVPSTGPSTVRPQKVNNAKASVTNESNRMIALKDFKHLPSGMTAATSKQYGSLTSGYGRESSSKDSKTEKGSGNA